MKLAERIQFDDLIAVDGKRYSVSEIIERLSPLATEDRLERMKQIICQRTLNIAPVLENIYDRGNISAVMRSAEAYGFMNFHVIEKPGARFKDSARVSKGTEKWLNTQRYGSASECVRSLRDRGFKIYCTHLEAAVSIEEVDFSGPTAVVLGNEKDGVSEEMVSLADGNFILPMLGFAQSFNISVAGALTFYHIFRERERLGVRSELSSQQKNQILANYLVRSVGSSAKILERVSQ